MRASTGLIARIAAEISREWKWVVLVAWALIAAWYLSHYAVNMRLLMLGDTDDNMRYLQVRDWLNGQSWWDLRQHRMAPPAGADIHWSRLVDLPIAALMLGLRPFVGAVRADELALGIAPLLPLLPLMAALAFITRQLDPRGFGWILAALLPLGAGMALSMFMPMRVDHHGWQLALTAIAVAGLVDPHYARGGIVAGVASALSVAIGMEMMVYLAGGGAMMGLRWALKPGAERRMVPYALALSGTTALCFLLFASNANRAAVCDALSPIWTTVLVLAGAMMLVLARLRLSQWHHRLAVGALAAMLLIAFVHAVWPQCLTGAYQLSDELERSWLAYVREAKPVTVQRASVWQPLIALPVTGFLCALIGGWRARHDLDRLWAWLTIALLVLFAGSLLLWQIRTGPAAQLLAIPPVAWALSTALRTIATGPWRARLAALALLLPLALVPAAYWLQPHAARLLTAHKGDKPATQAVARPGRVSFNVVARAGARCKSTRALQVLDQLPPGLIFTMVDLGPRILATTHHRVIAGPYHRNGDAILSVHRAMDGNADNFRAIAARYDADYLLICPNFPEGTIYSSRSQGGFYSRMLAGKHPGWLHPVRLDTPADLPFRLYRIEPLPERKSAKNARNSSADSLSPRPA